MFNWRYIMKAVNVNSAVAKSFEAWVEADSITIDEQLLIKDITY